MDDAFDMDPIGEADSGLTENRAHWASESSDGICAELSEPHEHNDGSFGVDVYYWDESGQMVGRDDGYILDE